MFYRKQHRVLILLTVALGLGISGCKKDPEPGSDNKIAAAANAANAGEIQVGQLAQAMASNAEVKSFATRMVNEHTATQQRQSALFARLGITPDDDATSRKLQSDAQDMLAMLRTRSGADFDLAYLDGQIVMHTQVLDLLNSSLIPAAGKDELRTDLSKMRDDVRAHQQAAKNLRSALGGVVPTDGGSGDGGSGDGGGGDGGGSDGGASDGGRDGGVRDGGTSDGSTDGGRRDGGMLRAPRKAQ